MKNHNRKIWIGSNLKMYKNNQQTLDYLRQLQELTKDIQRKDLTCFILPSYTALADACRQTHKSFPLIGAQNMHWEEQGQFTGEISPKMLQEIGVDIIMVGHAERREIFGETDWMVNKRVLSSLEYGFQTLICVGETGADRSYGISADRLRQQLLIALHAVEGSRLEQLWVAYEPVWAIGEDGQVSEPGYANKMHIVLREALERRFPGNGHKIPLLYGGSVNLFNTASLISQPDIDGLFIGRAAWDAQNFNAIIRTALQNIGAKETSTLV
jgi:L-erythrulose 1-phosphate isomerase